MIAAYARISVTHNDKKDDSIENQLRLIHTYIKENFKSRQEDFIEYTDCGYSGENFDRPLWKQLIKDIKNGNIDVFIVKDLSRIGRNYIETGEYIEKIFPLYNVRVISISENYDSDRDGYSFFSIGLRNIVNEWYRKDISNKVYVTKKYKKENGEYLGSTAPYGYEIIVEAGKRKLKEADTFMIIENIKNMRQKGKTSEQIAILLNQEKISTPAEYRETGRCTYEDMETDSSHKQWTGYMVRKLW